MNSSNGCWEDGHYWPRTHSSNLCQTRRTWSGAFTKQSVRHILCGEFCLVCPELFGVFTFSFLKTRLLKVVEGKIGTWSLPCLLSSPVRSDILHWFLFFPLSVLWFCYLDEVLSLVFNLSSIELSSVRQQTLYRGSGHTETFCLSVPWPKILSLSHREKVKRDIWTKKIKLVIWPRLQLFSSCLCGWKPSQFT